MKNFNFSFLRNNVQLLAQYRNILFFIESYHNYFLTQSFCSLWLEVYQSLPKRHEVGNVPVYRLFRALSKVRILYRSLFLSPLRDDVIDVSWP